MSFVSLEFFVFFSCVAIFYFMIPPRWRWLLLLGASYIFYLSWQVPYAFVLLFATIANYLVARLISQTRRQRRQNFFLIVGLMLNLSLLGLFKYLSFFADSMAGVLARFNLAWPGIHFTAALPVGISFYTFIAMAYLIDVYRKKFQAETRLGTFALFMAFFPQLIAGPISRASKLLPQLRQPTCANDGRIVEGLRLILQGTFKKIVIADRLAIYVNQVYDHLPNYRGPTLILATLFFAFQIYSDFSGYSEIAIGLARILGFHLPDNFKQPYFSRSLSEFWQRWHISLSTWIRDYLFFPLARKSLILSRGRFPRLVQLSVSLVVMGLVGLWHGAAWTFVAWGALHGLYLGVEGWFRTRQGQQAARVESKSRTRKLLQMGLTFVLVHEPG